MTLVQVTAPYFCAGLVLIDNKCVLAAPILFKLANGKTRSELRRLFAESGWTAKVVKQCP